MNYSTNYNIPLFEGTDVNYLPTYNTAFELIDSTLKTAYDTAQSAASSSGTATASIGDLTSLTTDVKSSVVGAINEVDANTDTNTSHIGTMTDLTTTVSSSLVGAINEIDAHTDTNTSNIGDLNDLTTTSKATLVGAINEVAGTVVADKVGDLSDLTTTDKTDAVGAINEVNAKVDANIADIGTLADLDTTVKTDLVSAINEVVNAGGNFNATLLGTIPTTSGTITLNDDYTEYDLILLQHAGATAIYLPDEFSGCRFTMFTTGGDIRYVTLTATSNTTITVTKSTEWNTTANIYGLKF